MRLSFLSSIRTQLMVLVLLVMLPVLGIMLYNGASLRAAAIRAAEDTALRQVQAMAAHHERVVDNARLLLTILAKSQAVQNLDSSSCRLLFDEALVRTPAYAALALADPAGQIVASSPPEAFSQVATAPFFHDALTEARFAMGAYHLMPTARRVLVEFAQPVLDEQENISGMMLAAFDLAYFGRIFADSHLPSGSIFTLTDATGMRLTRFPESEKYTWVPDLARMLAHMSGPDEEGTFLERGVDGTRRLYGFKTVRITDAPFPHLLLRLGLPEDLALSEARQVMVRNVALGLTAILVSVIAAWLVGKFVIVHRLDQLIQATERLGTGDLEVRTGMPHDTGELGLLAAAFDRMALSLEFHDMDRRRAEEECCQLNTELEERVMQRTAELGKTNAELHTALENLQQAQGQLVLSEKLAALGGLVAGIAHEINTPVGVALSATSTMAEKTRVLKDLFKQNEMKRSDLTSFLDSVHEGTEMSLLNLHRASNLIRGFKMVAADQVSETKRVFKVREYIGEILLSLRPKLKKTNITVDVICDEDLTIESYPGALSQILTIFIINSLTHAFDEGQAGQIRIEIRQDNNILKLTYADSGRGIAPEIQTRIFEPFFTTARAKGSTGLGLHIAFNVIAQTLGGTITCCSAPGQGTTFQISLPMENPHA